MDFLTTIFSSARFTSFIKYTPSVGDSTAKVVNSEQILIDIIACCGGRRPPLLMVYNYTVFYSLVYSLL